MFFWPTPLPNADQQLYDNIIISSYSGKNKAAVDHVEFFVVSEDKQEFQLHNTFEEVNRDLLKILQGEFDEVEESRKKKEVAVGVGLWFKNM